MRNKESEDRGRVGKQKEDHFLKMLCVFVFDVEAVTNQMLPPMMMIWHSTAKVFQSPSQKYFFC